MADELSLGIAFQLLDKFANEWEPTQDLSLLIDMTGNVISSGVQQIGTSKENLTLLSDHSTLGWALFMNLDDANYVSYGVDADNPFGEMKAGEPGCCRLSRAVSNVSMKANTAACWVAYIVLED